MHHQARVAPSLLAALVAVLLACAALASEPDVPLVDDKTFRERVLAPRKGRVVVVNFWATWCAPCIKEMPALKRAHRRFAKQPVDVVLVSVDFGEDAPAAIRKKLRELAIEYPVLLQKGGDPEHLIDLIDDKWQGDVPFTVIFDRQGRRARSLFGEQTEASFAKAIAAALAP